MSLRSWNLDQWLRRYLSFCVLGEISSYFGIHSKYSFIFGCFRGFGRLSFQGTIFIPMWTTINIPHHHVCRHQSLSYLRLLADLSHDFLGIRHHPHPPQRSRPSHHHFQCSDIGIFINFCDFPLNSQSFSNNFDSSHPITSPIYLSCMSPILPLATIKECGRDLFILHLLHVLHLQILYPLSLRWV
jgi:hypothetical protein